MASHKDAQSAYAELKVPLVPDNHGGVPQYLEKEAQKAKRDVLEGETLKDTPRQRPPAVPPGFNPEQFVKVLGELREELGSEHVEITDKDLVDGWYVSLPQETQFCIDEERGILSVRMPSQTQIVVNIVTRSQHS